MYQIPQVSRLVTRNFGFNFDCKSRTTCNFKSSHAKKPEISLWLLDQVRRLRTARQHARYMCVKPFHTCRQEQSGLGGAACLSRVPGSLYYSPRPAVAAIMGVEVQACVLHVPRLGLSGRGQEAEASRRPSPLHPRPSFRGLRPPLSLPVSRRRSPLHSIRACAKGGESRLSIRPGRLSIQTWGGRGEEGKVRVRITQRR